MSRQSSNPYPFYVELSADQSSWLTFDNAENRTLLAISPRVSRVDRESVSVVYTTRGLQVSEQLVQSGWGYDLPGTYTSVNTEDQHLQPDLQPSSASSVSTSPQIQYAQQQGHRSVHSQPRPYVNTDHQQIQSLSDPTYQSTLPSVDDQSNSCDIGQTDQVGSSLGIQHGDASAGRHDQQPDEQGKSSEAIES